MNTKQLRQHILDLAIHGKLVPQNPNDEPASILLERIRAEKEALIKEGKIKKAKKTTTSDTSHYENVEGPFEIPDTWCWCRIDGIGEVVTGSTPSKDNEDYYGGYIPFFKPTDLEQGVNTIDASDSLTEVGFSVSRRLPEQSILVTCIGATIGKTGMIQRKGACNQQINAVITNESIIPKYLYYACISGYMQGEIKGRASATTLPILNKNKFSEIPIPIPPILEQKRIVAEVDNLLMLVDKMDLCSQDLANYISLTKSKILDLAIHGKLVPQNPTDEPASELLKRINPKAVASCDNPHYPSPFQIPQNWVWCPLKNICTKIVDGDHNPPSGSMMKTPYKMLSSKNINNNAIVDTDDCRFLSYEDWEMCNSRTKLAKGDVLLTTVASLGRSCVNETDISFCFQRSVTVISTTISNYFLKFLFDSPYYQEVMNNSAKGTAQKGFYLNQVEHSLIPVPPMSEQFRIVARINELFSELDFIEESLQA